MDVEEFIKTNEKIYTKLLCDLISAKTVNPPGEEYLAAKVIKKRLSKIDVKYKLFEKIKHRTNVVAKVGNEKGKKLLICTHIDTVPAGDGWDTNPFEPVIKDGAVYGRGSGDNKGQVACAILVLEYLKSIEKQLKNEYIFVFAADEECGSTLGPKYLLNDNIINGDYALVVDVGGAMQKIDIAEKGVLNLKAVCKGKQAHGSTPHKGVSAIVNMSKFIAKLEHYALKADLHPFLSRPTINIGTISGGAAPNIVAGSCEAVLNIRYLPSQTPEGIIDELKKLSERFGDFSFEMMMKIPPTEVDSKNILVETIRSVAERHGIKPVLHGLSGATDTKAFILQGIPAVGYDFVDDHIAHSANEYCKLDSLFKFAGILIDICLEMNK